MPNWCECELTVSGPKERLEEFQEKVAGEEGALDANKIIPYPGVLVFLDKRNSFEARPPELSAEVKAEEAQLMLEGALEGYDMHRDGFNQGGYDWCIANWGTKWGFCEINGPILEERPRVSKLHYSFETAWSPPEPLIKKMGEMFPDLSFKLKYWEGGAGYRGELHIHKGEVVTDGNSDYRGNRGG